jgi:hypothetical protein
LLLDEFYINQSCFSYRIINSKVYFCKNNPFERPVPHHTPFHSTEYTVSGYSLFERFFEYQKHFLFSDGFRYRSDFGTIFKKGFGKNVSGFRFQVSSG